MLVAPTLPRRHQARRAIHSAGRGGEAAEATQADFLAPANLWAASHRNANAFPRPPQAPTEACAAGAPRHGEADGATQARRPTSLAASDFQGAKRADEAVVAMQVATQPSQARGWPFF